MEHLENETWHFKLLHNTQPWKFNQMKLLKKNLVKLKLERYPVVFLRCSQNHKRL